MTKRKISYPSFYYKRNCTVHCSLVLLNEQCLKWNGPFILTTAIAIRFPPLKDSANYSPNIVWDKHPPKTYLPKKNTLTSSYLKCVCLIYRFSKKKNHFQSPPKWAEAGAKARAGLIIPRGQSVSNHVVQAPKRFDREGLVKRRTDQSRPSGPSCLKTG